MNDSPSPKLSDLEDHLGYWLRHVSNHVSTTFARALQARQISVAEWVALRHLYDQPGISPGTLAELLGMTRGAISKVMEKLESKGLLTRLTNPEDSRAQTLALTPEGTQLLPELVAIADSNDEVFFGCLTADEQTQLRTILLKLSHVHQWKDVPVE